MSTAGIGTGLLASMIKIIGPGVGSLISATLAGAITWAIGKAAIKYFITNGDLSQDVREQLAKKKFEEEAKAEFEAKQNA